MFGTARSDCTGNRYCHKWRWCERCARIRSARFADRAEYLESKMGKLGLAVFKPEANTAEAIKKLRDQLVRNKLSPAGLWTVETGELYAGLHLNVLFPQTSYYNYRIKSEYAELIDTSARAAAAYITKRSGMPTKLQYDGKLIGEWGTIMQHIVASQTQESIVAKAAAINWAMLTPDERKKLHPGLRETMKQEHEEGLRPPERTMAEYQAIAKRNLSKIYEALNNSGRQEPRFNQTTGAML